MCISSEVSFGLAGLLLATGTYCVVRAVRCDKLLMPLALVPLVFGVQQVCEGAVWLGLNHAEPQVVKVSGLVYLFFALLFWPFWMPFSALSMESRRHMWAPLRVMTLLGLILGSCLFLPILAEPAWLSITVVQDSIYYDTSASPVLGVLPNAVWQLVYLVVVAVPLFVSPVWRMLHFGLAVVLSAAVSRILFPYAAASIWCFFAAALSMYLSGLFFRLPLTVVNAPSLAD